MKTKTTSATTPGRAPAAPRQARGPRSAGTAGGAPLSNKQKAVIAQTARQAWDIQVRAGFTDGLTYDEWRHAEQAKACGTSSLRAATNNHYRPLMAHFLTLAGKDVPAFRLYVKTGRATGHGDVEDTHENRETQRHLIMAEIIAHGHRCDASFRHATYDPKLADHAASLGGIITAAYVLKIAQGKCRGRGINSLTAPQLAQVLYTAKNRIAAREGRGATANRNQKQRKTTP